MPTSWSDRALQIRSGELTKACSVPGCRLPTYRMSSTCEPHRQALRTKGSTTAGRVTIRELRPNVIVAMAFIVEQEAKAHPAILAALDYLERLTKTAAELERDSPRQGQRPRPGARVDSLLARFRRDSVDLRLVLATGIACELHRLSDPRRWPDHRHASHQFAAAVACLARGRSRGVRTEGASRPAIRSPSTGFLRELARQLRDPLTPLYIRAATSIHDRAERLANPVPRAALDQPFTSDSHRTTSI
ncbi:hypothetical protein [Nevskia ramosa]|uniref:hypothetical protein n=1 Tax=Nevskia ramosa TaxID=64002 RepID=UPI0023568756|nr:hypothetical protein [Nevskia ramosa]